MLGALTHSIKIQEALAFARQEGLAILDAEILLASVLTASRANLISGYDKTISAAQVNAFIHALSQRKAGMPVAYILGSKSFWSLELEVNQATLIPRPETELLIETILKRFNSHTHLKVADIGTGSGAIALALAAEKPQWEIHATDKSGEALTTARKNAERYRFSQVSFYQGHLLSACPDRDYDLIVSNPPYLTADELQQAQVELKYEPADALVYQDCPCLTDLPDITLSSPHAHGLCAIAEIVTMAHQYLKPGGLLLFEHGFLHGAKVRDILMGSSYTNVFTLKDLAALDRVTGAEAPAKDPIKQCDG